MAEQESSEDSPKSITDDEVTAVVVADSTVPDWTESEERWATRKVDLVLLPILFFAFFVLQMDRGNIANALTSTITTDLGIDTNKINVGTSLMSTGIVLLEIPSNIVLQRVGPAKWLSAQIIIWGTVATLQNFITNYGGYLSTRFILGLCEAGFIPGALYTMSTWYKKSESSSRIAIFFLGNLIASALTSLIGAGVLSMGPRYGVAGWRWLFIVEGTITVGIGILFTLLLPPAVGNGSPLISRGRWSYFTPREDYILTRRVLLDDPAKAQGKLKISGTDVWKTIINPRILYHVLITLIATISVSGIQSYAPSIIKSLGFTTVKSNALASVGNFIAAILVVTLGFIADKTGRRGPVVIIAAIWCFISYTCLRESTSDGQWRRYAAVVAATATNSIVHILNVGWVTVNCKNPQQRSVSMAMLVMGANAGAIAGAQVFRTGDAPLYRNAFTAMLALSAICLVMAIALMVWYFMANRRLAKKGGEVERGNADGVEIVRAWWWTW